MSHPDQPERILWPKFLSHVRDIFSLDADEGLDERVAHEPPTVSHFAGMEFRIWPNRRIVGTDNRTNHPPIC
jgi:hypothetical protein